MTGALRNVMRQHMAVAVDAEPQQHEAFFAARLRAARIAFEFLQMLRQASLPFRRDVRRAAFLQRGFGRRWRLFDFWGRRRFGRGLRRVGRWLFDGLLLRHLSHGLLLDRAFARRDIDRDRRCVVVGIVGPMHVDVGCDRGEVDADAR